MGYHESKPLSGEQGFDISVYSARVAYDALSPLNAFNVTDKISLFALFRQMQTPKLYEQLLSTLRTTSYAGWTEKQKQVVSAFDRLSDMEDDAFEFLLSKLYLVNALQGPQSLESLLQRLEITISKG